MSSKTSTPKCPFCGANYQGSHACQRNDNNDYFRTLANGRAITPEVESMRKFYDQPMSIPSEPWEEED